jgi:hypothetical protein
MMTSFERSDVVRLLDVDDAFLEVLERESIVYVDVEERRFSPRMVERVRVAHSLVFELEVNLSGVAVILRMREQLGSMHGALSRAQEILHQRELAAAAEERRDERDGE